jgi:hypothetical protein
MTVTNIYGIAWPPHSEAYELPCGALWLRFLKSTHLVARWRRHFWLFFAIFSSFFSVAKRGSWCRSSAHKDMRKVSLESEICSTWQEETYHNYNYDICQNFDCYEDFCGWKYKFHQAWHPPAWKTKIDWDAVFQFLYFVKFLFFSNLYFVKFFDMNTFSLLRKKSETERKREREMDLYIVIFFVKFFDINTVSLSLAYIQFDHKLLSSTNPAFVFTVFLLYNQREIRYWWI